MKKLKTMCGGVAVLSMCWLASGCSNDAEVITRGMQDLSTNTMGKITVRIEIGSWGKKGVFIFEDVNRSAFHE